MADTSVKLVLDEGGKRSLRDPVELLGGALLQATFMLDDAPTTLPEVLAAKASLGAIPGLDADWEIPSGAVHVVVPPLTASHRWELPDADTYPPGQDLVIHDERRVLVGSGLVLTLVPLAGSDDTIPGYANNEIRLDGSVPFVRLRRGYYANTWDTL